MALLTERQAFEAMVLFLEDYQERGPSEDVAILPSWMSLTPGDNATADPAIWFDWEKCVRKVLDEQSMNEFNTGSSNA
jgi:hypothetical protein